MKREPLLVRGGFYTPTSRKQKLSCVPDVPVSEVPGPGADFCSASDEHGRGNVYGSFHALEQDRKSF